MGTPEFAVEPLKTLIEKKYNIVGIVTPADKPSGRGQKINISAVKEFALKSNIGLDLPILQPVSLKDPDFISELKALNADLFIVVAFRMLPKIVWSMPPLGTFNLHASLLPKYRGAAPINHAIINGENITGVTTFLLDEKIDTGSILFREECPILDTDNIGSLYEKLMSIGSLLVVKTVDALISGNISPISQSKISEINENLLPKAPKITRETRIIDWTLSAERINNLVRGLSPYPCTYSSLVIEGKAVETKLYKTKLLTDSKAGLSVEIGKTTTDGKTYLRVQCDNGELDILELQLAGKKRLSIKDFLAGQHQVENIYFV